MGWKGRRGCERAGAVPDTRPAAQPPGGVARSAPAGLNFRADMHDDLKWNKVFGTVLATSLAILMLRQGTEMAFAGHPPKKPGYVIAVQETAAEGGAEADSPPDWGTVLKTADVSAGQTVSGKCQSCHNFASGGPNLVGPNLYGVVGRKPGSHPGFSYSTAMAGHSAKDPVWNDDALYNFLKAPSGYVAGTKMGFVGLKKREDRINVIAYLRTLGSTIPVPAPDPARAAGAAGAPANAAGSAPAPDAGTTVPAKPGDATAPAAVDGAAPANGQTDSPGGVTPASGAAASPSQMTSTNPGGPPLAGTTLGGSKALAARPSQKK